MSAALVAEAEELVQRGDGAGVAAEPRGEGDRASLVHPGDRVEHAVDDERAKVVREHVGVGLAQERAVRDAVVGELRVPYRLAEDVEVTRHVRGRHVIDDVASALRARVDEVKVRRHPGVLLLRRQRERKRREERLPLLRGAEAAQRRASRDAARIEADEVEPRPHLVREEERTGAQSEVDTRTARPAGIQEQRADPVRRVGRGEADESDRDRAPRRLVVVERHLHGSALERAGGLEALAPADLRLRRRRRHALVGRVAKRQTQQHAQGAGRPDPLTRHGLSLSPQRPLPTAICAHRAARVNACHLEIRLTARHRVADTDHAVRDFPLRAGSSWTGPGRCRAIRARRPRRRRSPAGRAARSRSPSSAW